MKCPLHTDEGAELVLDYCSRKLDIDTTIAFERHLAHCVDCALVVEAQRNVWDALDSYESLPAVSDDFDSKLWKRIEDAEARPWWQKLASQLREGPAMGWGSVLSWKPAMVTASACAAIMLVMLVVRPPDAIVNPPASGDVPAYAEKAMVEQRSVDLDQVEGTIEDLDMLKQLGVMDEADNQPSAM